MSQKIAINVRHSEDNFSYTEAFRSSLYQIESKGQLSQDDIITLEAHDVDPYAMTAIISIQSKKSLDEILEIMDTATVKFNNEILDVMGVTLA